MICRATCVPTERDADWMAERTTSWPLVMRPRLVPPPFHQSPIVFSIPPRKPPEDSSGGGSGACGGAGGRHGPPPCPAGGTAASPQAEDRGRLCGTEVGGTDAGGTEVGAAAAGAGGRKDGVTGGTAGGTGPRLAAVPRAFSISKAEVRSIGVSYLP